MDYCFCTLAVGTPYRKSALLLCQDLEKYSPSRKVIILSDRPEDFHQQSNVIAFKHSPVSVSIYHDKRLVIAKALSNYESCIFLDANVRIKQEVPENINFKPGIVAYTCHSLAKHVIGDKNKNYILKGNTLAMKIYKLTYQISIYYNLNLEDCQSIFEGIFYVTRSPYLENFLETWNILSIYYEINGVYTQESLAIALASKITDFPIYYDYGKKINVFKDVLERQRIKSGVARYEDNQEYFEDLRKIENLSEALWSKIWKKLYKNVIFYFRLMNLWFDAYPKHKDLYKKFSEITPPDIANINVL